MMLFKKTTTKTTLLPAVLLVVVTLSVSTAFVVPNDKITSSSAFTTPTSTSTSTSTSSSFVRQRLTTSTINGNRNRETTSTIRHEMMTTSSDVASDIEASRSAFYFWFFGGSGAAGIALSSFPKMYQRQQSINQLKDVGPTLGNGKKSSNNSKNNNIDNSELVLQLNPLCLYPQNYLYIADIQQIINNKLTIQQMVDRYPIEGNFLSRKGYLTYDAYVKANSNSNPLTLRIIFDTFAQSTDVCNPMIAQEKIDLYRQDVNQIGTVLLKSRVTGYAAIGVLVFLLSLVSSVIIGHAYHGWFPSWPGGTNFPFSVFDNIQENGPWTIPNYWI